MKNQLLNFVLTLILAFCFSFFMPWWSVMLAAFISACVAPLKGFGIFLIPFLSIFVLWICYAWFLSASNDYILAEKIAVLFPLGGNVLFLLLLTGLIGGLAAGFSGILGNQSLGLLKKK